MKKFIYLLLVSVFTIAFTACSDDDEPEMKVKVNIQNNGKEINNNDVITYNAEADVFGEFVAGPVSDPSIKTSEPCKLEVSITIPENELDYIQWCGIDHACLDYRESGTFTRSNDKAQNEAMEMHAHFKAGVYTSCKVKVDVKVNDKPVRTFYIEYVYAG